MRERLIELSENLSSLESASQACFDRLGGAPRAVPQSRIDFQDLDIDRNAVLIQASDVTPALIGPTGAMHAPASMPSSSRLSLITAGKVPRLNAILRMMEGTAPLPRTQPRGSSSV